MNLITKIKNIFYCTSYMPLIKSGRFSFIMDKSDKSALRILKALTAANPSIVNMQDNTAAQNTLLSWVTEKIECTKFLLESGADPSIPSRISGFTPVHFAAEWDIQDSTKVLEHYMATPHPKKTKNGVSPLDVAIATSNNAAVVKILPYCNDSELKGALKTAENTNFGYCLDTISSFISQKEKCAEDHISRAVNIMHAGTARALKVHRIKIKGVPT